MVRPLLLPWPMRALWLSSVAMLSACVGGSEPAPAPALELSAPLPLPAAAPCSTTTVALQPPTALRMSQVNSIAIDVSLDRGCRADAVRVELISPSGSVFEVRSSALNGGKQARFTFPVAGAAIEQRGLAGPWQVRTLVDGKSAAPATFELTR